MLYLINETFYNKDTKEIIDILKIGYTSDSIKPGTRYTTYLNHCPEAKLLYKIQGGTLDHEAALLSKFHHLLYKGQEWFRYSQEIIDYFETHKTLESLSDLKLPEIQYKVEIKNYCDKCLNLLLHERVSSGELSLDQATKSIKSMLNVLLSKRFKNTAQIDRYFLSIFEFDVHKIKSTEFLVQFDSYTQFTDKMKLLCDYRFEGEDLRAALESIPIIYSNYYTILGPDIIRSLSYQKSKLEREYSSLINNQGHKESLLDLLMMTFIVGERYPLVFIKNSLREIYNKLELNLSPKASDLINYFDVKKVIIINKETGKKDHGYEIIKIKE